MEQKSFEVPWLQSLAELRAGGVKWAYALHGNIFDYPYQRQELLDLLWRAFAKRATVVLYSRTTGFTFAPGASEKEFRELVLDTDGFTPTTTELPREPEQALPLIDKFLHTAGASEARPGLVLLHEAQLLTPPGDWASLRDQDRLNVATVAAWGRDLDIGNDGNTVFLISESLKDLHSYILASNYEPVRIPLPTEAQRLEFIEWFGQNEQEPKWAAGYSKELLARQAGGLRLRDLDDILMRSLYEQECNASFVSERKRVIYQAQYAGLLEPVESKVTLDQIGGYEHVKTYLRQDLVEAFVKGYLDEVPMGLLMIGPPGTGKTTFAYALANAIGFQAVEFKVGNSTSMWQGEGEKNVRKALEGLEALAPVLVWMDEIDQQLSRGTGGGQNQQESRIFQYIAQFMADPRHRGRIIFCAASNRPDLLDDALLRAERFGDAIIPVLLPTRADRAAILRIYADRSKLAVTNPQIDSLLDATENWSGTDLKAFFREVLTLKRRGLANDLEAALAEARRNLRPTVGAGVEEMTRLAIKFCNNRRLIPPEYYKYWDPPAPPPAPDEGALEYKPQRRRREVTE